MKPYVTVGLTVLAGAALFEAALIPGILIGGAAVLAPALFAKGALPRLRRVQTVSGKTAHQQAAFERFSPGAAEEQRGRKTSFPNSPSGRRSPRPSLSGLSSPPSISPPTTW